MKVILHMAISLNSMIARANDDTDFLSHDNWIIFVELAHQVGAFIWGRKTHESVRTYGASFFDDLKDVHKVVISTQPGLVLESGWQLVHSPEQALQLLEASQVHEVLLVGGAHLNSAFARLQRIDEVILNIEPVLVGQGIPLFTPDQFDLKLRLLEMKRVRENLLQLHYAVVKSV